MGPGMDRFMKTGCHISQLQQQTTFPTLISPVYVCVMSP